MSDAPTLTPPRPARRLQARIGIALAALVPLAVAFLVPALREAGGRLRGGSGPALPFGELIGFGLGAAIGIGTGSLSAWTIGPFSGILVGLFDLLFCFSLVAWLRVPAPWAASVPAWGAFAGLMVAAQRRAPRRAGLACVGLGALADLTGRWSARWLVLAQAPTTTSSATPSPWIILLAYGPACLLLGALAMRPQSPKDSATGSARPWLAAAGIAALLLLGPVIALRAWYGGIARVEGSRSASATSSGPIVLVFGAHGLQVGGLQESHVCARVEQLFLRRGFALQRGSLFASHAEPGAGEVELHGFDPARGVGFQMDLLGGGFYGADADPGSVPAVLAQFTDDQGRTVYVLRLDYPELNNVAHRMGSVQSGPRGMLGIDAARAGAANAGNSHQANAALVSLVDRRTLAFLDAVGQIQGR